MWSERADRRENGRVLDVTVRREIYSVLAATGHAPSHGAIVELVGDTEEAGRVLRRLHEAHALVVDDTGEILMALPFAARPTQHRVLADSRSWWANCAWDSLAIPAALGIDARIEAAWLDTGEPVQLAIDDGQLNRTDGFIHFTIPAHHWWDDIVET